VSGQLHDPAASSPGKEPLVPNGLVPILSVILLMRLSLKPDNSKVVRHSCDMGSTLCIKFDSVTKCCPRSWTDSLERTRQRKMVMRLHVRPRGGLEDNIRMNLACGLDRYQWRALVNTVIKLRVP